MAAKLNEEYQEQLEQWIGTGPKSFKLLFSATRDGCNNSTFHSKCDNQGPTVTVLYNTNNTVYGGYTSCNWASSGGSQCSDGSAFLFQLCLNGSPRYIKFPIKSSNFNYAIYNSNTYGPMFGGNSGYDLYAFSGSVSFSSGQFSLNGSVSYGTNYDMQGVSQNDFNNGHMRVTELEVYKVEVGTNTERRRLGNRCVSSLLLDEPWRELPEWGEDTVMRLKEELQAFKPEPELKVAQSRILMLGPIGAGKSSFFNTINSIFLGRLSHRSCSGSAEHSMTMVYRQYQVKSAKTGSFLNFRLCDTRGLEEEQDMDILEVNYLLEGNVPDWYQFSTSATISQETPGFNTTPGIKDKIHCIAFVFDASTFDILPKKVLEKIHTMQTRLNQKGISQIVLLTKIDKVCKLVEKDVANVFKSEAIRDAVDKVAQTIRIPRSNVLPVKNYENEINLNSKVSILALLALRQILWFSDDYLANCLDKLHAGNTERIQKMTIKD